MGNQQSQSMTATPHATTETARHPDPTVTTMRFEMDVAARRPDWRSRLCGVGFSVVVHAVVMGIAAIICIHRQVPAVVAYLDSQWSIPETPVVELDVAVEIAPSSEASQPTLNPGGSSLAELLDLARIASPDEVSVTRDVVLKTPLVDATWPRSSPATKPRAKNVSKQGSQQPGLGQGLGEGNGIGNGKGFFGSTPQGRRIVFVVDNSRSMNHKHDSPAKTRYRRVKVELVKSILEMPPESEFYVIFFCNETLPMPARDLQPATPELKDRYLRWVVQVDSGGGPTDPRDAMQTALRLQPDLIYFLTDGEFQRGVNLKLLSIAQSRTVIHTFAFGERLGEDVLKAIARKNRGEYKFIP